MKFPYPMSFALPLNCLLRAFNLRLEWCPDWDAILRDVDLFVDVGAHRGETVQRFKSQGYRGKFVCFEANPDLIPALQKIAPTHCAVLSYGSYAINFKIRAEDGRSSILHDCHVEHPGYAITKTIPVTTRRLDSFNLPSQNIFLKVDTEGNDLNVIAGAAGILDRVKYIMLELSPEPRFHGEPPMETVIKEMRQRGFVPAFFERNIFPSLTARKDCEAFDMIFRRQGAGASNADLSHRASNH
jgi:FkbM family methyltransferase